MNSILSRIKYLNCLKDEIEQIDVYQLRFNAHNESQEFIKHISAYNNDIRRLSIDDDNFKIKVSHILFSHQQNKSVNPKSINFLFF